METQFKIKFRERRHPIYVNARSEQEVAYVVGCVFKKWDFDHFDYEIMGKYEGGKDLLRGDNPPFLIIIQEEDRDGNDVIVKWEKRVNQAGFKGFYSETLWKEGG